MASINDISIALNSLFLDITDPITLGLNKNDFFEIHGNISFRYEPDAEFEFTINPLITFDSESDRLKFLEKELQIANRFQDFQDTPEIEAVLAEELSTPTLENFRLDYTIEVEADKVLIVFDTNSLIFKYEVIG